MPSLNEVHDLFEQLGIGLPAGLRWKHYPDNPLNQWWLEGWGAMGDWLYLSGPVALYLCLAAAAEWLWDTDLGIPEAKAGESESFADAVWAELKRLAAARA